MFMDKCPGHYKVHVHGRDSPGRPVHEHCPILLPALVAGGEGDGIQNVAGGEGDGIQNVAGGEGDVIQNVAGGGDESD